MPLLPKQVPKRVFAKAQKEVRRVVLPPIKKPRLPKQRLKLPKQARVFRKLPATPPDSAPRVRKRTPLRLVLKGQQRIRLLPPTVLYRLGQPLVRPRRQLLNPLVRQPPRVQLRLNTTVPTDGLFFAVKFTPVRQTFATKPDAAL